MLLASRHYDTRLLVWVSVIVPLFLLDPTFTMFSPLHRAYIE